MHLSTLLSERSQLKRLHCVIPTTHDILEAQPNLQAGTRLLEARDGAGAGGAAAGKARDKGDEQGKKEGRNMSYHLYHGTGMVQYRYCQAS
jgi:hypothetical protein